MSSCVLLNQIHRSGSVPLSLLFTNVFTIPIPLWSLLRRGRRSGVEDAQPILAKYLANRRFAEAVFEHGLGQARITGSVDVAQEVATGHQVKTDGHMFVTNEIDDIQ